jgi:hypothetical protein
VKKFLYLIAAVLSISGCVTDDQPSTPPDYGVLPPDYKSDITNYFNANLKDPYSAHYTFYEPVETSWYQGWSTHKFYGWKVMVDVNAKNSFGGYTGNQSYFFTFAGGVLYNVLTPDNAFPQPP